ncbi:MAG: glycosyltransferase [Deltaproteobacteria bacterium]|nr:glycosyltransferase [Deltaproteobacteria bacterium]
METTYDVAVGIPSYNEADTIGHVVEVAGRGLRKYFPDLRCIIVNCDNSSPDGTKDVFLSTNIPAQIDKQYISTPEGVKGKGNNFFNLFNFCREKEVKITIVVDADLRSITPEWIRYLGKPIGRGYDFVAPLYSRHQFDGTITNHLCYPLGYSLTGLDIRQPIGGDFAFSSALCDHWLKQEWNEMARQYGIDIFMSLNAQFNKFRICESGLGTKVHKASSPKLGQMFEEVVYTLFSILIENRSKWLSSWSKKWGQGICHPGGSCSVSSFGLEKMGEPQELKVDIAKLKQDCRKEYYAYKDLVEKYLSPYAFNQIKDMVDMDYYSVDIMLWSQIVYSLLYTFDGSPEEVKRDIINVLKPLYFARSITFDYKTSHFSVPYSEREVRSQAMAFLSQKPYLLGLYLGNGKYHL